MNNTFEFWTSEDRLSYIQTELHEKVEVIKTDDDNFVKVRVTLNENIDALYLFHAGVNYGAKIK
jgi:hypothetical protein